jgi:hypothetical protein
VNRFIDHLKVVNANNYNTIAISTLYSLLKHTVYCYQTVTRRFLVTAPAMAIPLHKTRSQLTKRDRVTLRLAVYRQSVRLGDKPLETHDQ